MTKEEALKVFRSYKIWDLMDNFTTNELQEMIDAIVSTPSLPSNLDEAEKEYAYRGIPDIMKPTFKPLADEVAKYFKAGAEWMAGQGVIYEDAVVFLKYRNEFGFYNTDIDNGNKQGVCSDYCIKQLGLNDGDKVVVQIRKK